MPKDRTAEFRACIEQAKRTGGAGATAAYPHHHHPMSQFTAAASQIAKDITSTTNKLQKLTKLVQSSTVFDDPTSQIQELTVVIKQDVTSLNSRIDQLHEYRQRAGYGHGTQSKRHGENVLNTLKSALGTASTEFKDILQKRTESLKQQDERRGQYVSSEIGPASVLRARPGSQLNTPSSSSSLALVPTSRNSNDGNVVLDMSGTGGMTTQVLQGDQYLDSRRRAIESIQTTLVELGGLFTQITSLVSQQEDLVQRIDADVDDTVTNVERGEKELLKYFKTLSSNRWLMIKVFFVLIIFVVLFMGFVV